MTGGLMFMILGALIAALLMNEENPELLDEIIDGLMGRNEEKEEERK